MARIPEEDDFAQQRHFRTVTIGQPRWALYHGDIDSISPKIGLAAIHRGDSQLDIGMERGEPAKARDQPPCGKRGWCAATVSTPTRR